jgi:hypothetical protein
MRAEFRVSEEQINGIRESLKTERKVEPVFVVEVRDEGGNVIAEVEKILHVRRKDGK